MKKITLLALLSFLTLSSIAQNKFGYIDSQELLMLMPERKTAETEVANFAKSLEDAGVKFVGPSVDNLNTFGA